MFDVIKDLEKKLPLLDERLMLKEILDNDSIQRQIIDLQTEAGGHGQLYDLGVQSDGSPTGDYALITIAYYKPLAASQGRDGRSDHITGKDTGKTYDSMRVVNESDGFTIIADDRNNFFAIIPKGLGLTKESISLLTPEISARIIERINSVFND